jgi:hypothetical protein
MAAAQCSQTGGWTTLADDIQQNPIDRTRLGRAGSGRNISTGNRQNCASIRLVETRGYAATATPLTALFSTSAAGRENDACWSLIGSD